MGLIAEEYRLPSAGGAGEPSAAAGCRQARRALPIIHNNRKHEEMRHDGLQSTGVVTV